VHPKTQTPLLSTCVCAVISAVLSAFVPIDALVDLVALGTLVAFGVVSLGVLWRR
jgi:amino acid transporter